MASMLQSSVTKPALSQQQLMDIIQLQSTIGSADFALQPFMNLVVESLRQFTTAKGAVIEMVDGDDMVYRAATGSVKDYMGMRLARAGSLSGLCVVTGEIEICDDTSTDPRVNYEACKEIGAVSMMLVPLRHKDAIVGVLKVISDRVSAFGATEIYTMQLLAGIMGSALGQQMEVRDRRRIEDKLRFQAQNDSLTGLPNRMVFYDRLTHAHSRQSRSGLLLCLMYMDLDGFKAVNDRYGHAAGDQVLQIFADRVQKIVRSSDTFARLGGDEFTLIAENIRNRHEAALIADKIMQAVKEPFELSVAKVNVGVSIGIAMLEDSGITPSTLLEMSDSALYEAKRAGRNQYRFSAES